MIHLPVRWLKVHVEIVLASMVKSVYRYSKCLRFSGYNVTCGEMWQYTYLHIEDVHFPFVLLHNKIEWSTFQVV